VWLVVGLGNPGREYEDTRHNVGFRVVDLIAARAGSPAWRSKWGAEIVETKIGSERVLLCKPMEFMNVSGQPVVRVAAFWKVDPPHTVVVHDDLDVPFGRLKLGQGGGHGGNNGVRSLLAEWGTGDFHRVRVGIGRPAPGRDAAAWVLSRFADEDQGEVPAVLERAADAASCIVTDGPQVAMNRFNGKAGATKAAPTKGSEKSNGRSNDKGDDT
jgi:PTH1 family peptidyl-tRNA hydrolase